MGFDVTKALAQCELFATLRQEEITPVASLCRVAEYQAGDKIFGQGDLGSTIYVIHEGLVTLQRTVDLGERTATIDIATLGPGRAFGCWASILGQPHNVMSSALCNQPTVVIAIEGSALREVLHRDSPAGFKVLENLARLLGERLRGVYGAMEKL